MMNMTVRILAVLLVSTVCADALAGEPLYFTGGRLESIAP